MKPLDTVSDNALVKALAHPLRVQIMSILEHRSASPNELANEIGQPLGNVSYHVRKLERLGLIKLVKETPRRGAVEHYYRLDVRPSITDEGWAAAPSIVKEALASAVISQIGREVATAAGAGGFEREDIHLSRVPLMLDDQGFHALALEAARFIEKARGIEEASAKRLGRKTPTAPVPSHLAVMLFEGQEVDPSAKAPPRPDSRSRAKRSRATQRSTS